MRFTVVTRADGRVGVLDTTKATFAEFITAPGQVWEARERADRAAARLNDSTDTITGYVWEKA